MYRVINMDLRPNLLNIFLKHIEKKCYTLNSIALVLVWHELYVKTERFTTCNQLEIKNEHTPCTVIVRYI